MKYNSLAMIETNGLVPALSALDKMIKLGNIEFLKKEVISNGQVAIFVSGDIPHINKVLQAGVIAAQNVGIVVSSSVIENPSNKILDLVLENNRDIPKSKRNEKLKKKIKSEPVQTLFDNLNTDETAEEHFEINTEVENKIGVLAFTSDEEKIKELSRNKNIEMVLSSEKERDDSSEVTNNSYSENEIVIEEAKNEIKEEMPEQDELDKLSNEKLEFEENDKFSGLSHLKRLRAEAKSEINKELKSEPDIVPEENRNEDETVESVEEKKESSDDENDYSKMNVHQLRKLARNNKNFPIKGREISKANRKTLLEYFNQIL